MDRDQIIKKLVDSLSNARYRIELVDGNVYQYMEAASDILKDYIASSECSSECLMELVDFLFKDAMFNDLGDNLVVYWPRR